MSVVEVFLIAVGFMAGGIVFGLVISLAVWIGYQPLKYWGEKPWGVAAYFGVATGVSLPLTVIGFVAGACVFMLIAQ